MAGRLKNRPRRLDGSRIYLRRTVLDDVNDRYLCWLNDPEINQYMETRFQSWSKEDIRKFVRDMDDDPDSYLFAICLQADKRHVGNIKLGPVSPRHFSADISLFIGEKEYWGNGYAAEAIRVVTGFAFDILDLNKVNAGCYASNRGSAKAFERAGFRLEGRLRDQYLYRGNYVDGLLFGCTCKDRDRFRKPRTDG